MIIRLISIVRGNSLLRIMDAWIEDIMDSLKGSVKFVMFIMDMCSDLMGLRDASIRVI